MKYRGKKLEGRNKVVLVLPREDVDIALIMEAVENFDAFDALVTVPKPPEVLLPGNIREHNFQDPAYIERLDEYATQKTNYMTIESLKATTDIEWETVAEGDPTTWGNWATELAEAGFTDIELSLVIRKVAQANCLDQSMLDSARSAFLRERAHQSEST